MGTIENSIPRDGLDRIRLFRRQYLQLLDQQHITWPSAEHLRNANVQEWLFEQCFTGYAFLPPARYQLRVLKTLVAKVEDAIVDPEEDEISDNLMTALSELMFAPLPDEMKAVQQKSWVTYTLISSEHDHATSETPLRILENRSVISGAGTTGLRTWEAALHLGSYLQTSPEARALVEGKRVIELGAGTGLLALMCAGVLGAKQVIATDGDEGVVEALKENTACNEPRAEVKCAQLWWGHTLKDSWLIEEFAPHPCDLVLGADVTYDKVVIPALVSTIRDLFEAWPKVQVIISATIRNEDTFSAFEHACKYNKFTVTEIDHPLVPMHQQISLFHSVDVPIKIWSITAPAKIKDPFAF
ncbi:hypothetical protein AAFC00_004084 [Neodothiora populina]|uniref:Uncharacterized protein n=1 Tax=Neodothiora populina TaxID=2781224 RepID=A0ABR3PIG9_9PEZI